VIKVIAPAQRHPANRSLADFHRYWAESHGPLFAKTAEVRRYVQHLTLPEAYGGEPAPTFDGASIFWYDDLEALRRPSEAPEAFALREAVIADDRQLFDRSRDWPMHLRRASVVAQERVVVEGETRPSMVKAVFIASRLPGLTLDEFFGRWYEVHGVLAAKLPGLRRYVQNHALPEAYTLRGMTHDGWSELWFDSLDSLRLAVASPSWQALVEDGRTLFAPLMGIVVARETVQKELGALLPQSAAASWSEEEIRQRLEDQGYMALAAEPDAPRKIRFATANGALAIWTAEHLVTIDASRIDARPER